MEQQLLLERDLELLTFQLKHDSPKSLISEIQQLKKTIMNLSSCSAELKMMMNTTYGYTAGAFSGHMPVIEVADTILQLSRETLEMAIRLIETKFSGLRVVYADTDSMFVDTSGLIGI